MSLAVDGTDVPGRSNPRRTRSTRLVMATTVTTTDPFCDHWSLS
jgi:hypothetical protein